jgi:hypothetical protein
MTWPAADIPDEVDRHAQDLQLACVVIDLPRYTLTSHGSSSLLRRSSATPRSAWWVPVWLIGMGMISWQGQFDFGQGTGFLRSTRVVFPSGGTSWPWPDGAWSSTSARSFRGSRVKKCSSGWRSRQLARLRSTQGSKSVAVTALLNRASTNRFAILQQTSIDRFSSRRLCEQACTNLRPGSPESHECRAHD